MPIDIQKEIFKKNLSHYLDRTHKTQVEVATDIGVSPQTFNTWIQGIAIPRMGKIQLLADYFGINKSDLLEDHSAINAKNELPISKYRTVKIYGRIAGGKPIEMIENVIDEVDLSTLPEKYDGHYFGLQIRGHSMEPDIKDGDYIICVEAEDAESGDIVAVTVNGEDATCKRILKYKDGIRLVPLNPSYEVKYYTNKEVLSLPVRVIGRVLEARHRFHD